jgi:hypothetical protein
MAADRPPGEGFPTAGNPLDVGTRLLAAHAAGALAELLQLAHLAERLGRLDELPPSTADAMLDLHAAIKRWS